MHRSVLAVFALTAMLVVVPIAGARLMQAQQPYAAEPLQDARDRLDRPVDDGQANRTWFWGPAPISDGIDEPYVESPGGERLVQYIDKARFELTQPDGDPDDPWYVSTGLLTREMISGSVQVGDGSYELRDPANTAMAGDASNTWPTYAGFERVIDQLYEDVTGQFATNALLVSGVTSYPEAGDDPNAEIVQYVAYDGPAGPVGYNVPAAFWEFMNADGIVWTGEEFAQAEPLFDWLFVMGLPISDPFWVTVQLDDDPTWVMVQAFERRVLTYTPSNPEGWTVEMGNVGRHYFEWRYAGAPPVEPEPPTPTPPATITPVPTPTIVPGGEGPGSDFFAMQPGNSWTYQDAESGGLYEVHIIGRTSEFIDGEWLLIRRESRPDGSVELSYWDTDDSILWLYGREELTPEGDLKDRFVYDPPVRYVAKTLALGEGWGTNSWVERNGIRLGLIQFSFQVMLTHQMSVSAGTFLTSYIRATEAPTDGDNLTGPIEIVSQFDFTPFYGIVRDERGDDTVLELVVYSLN